LRSNDFAARKFAEAYNALKTDIIHNHEKFRDENYVPAKTYMRSLGIGAAKFREMKEKGLLDGAMLPASRESKRVLYHRDFNPYSGFVETRGLPCLGDERHSGIEENARRIAKRQEAFWEQRKAVCRSKAAWYLARLMARGIRAADVFAAPAMGIFLREDWSEFYLQCIGKSFEELRSGGTYEELMKARVISDLCDSVDKGREGDIAAWLGCDECPSEALNRARVSAL